MNNVESILRLKRIAFNKIEFNRKGFKNDNEEQYSFEIQIANSESKVFRVTIVLTVDKRDEYQILISLSGFFSFNEDDQLEKEQRDKLLHSNAVAILMPYVRSELTLLTAQPETESIVMPPLNINKLLERETDQQEE